MCIVFSIFLKKNFVVLIWDNDPQWFDQTKKKYEIQKQLNNISSATESHTSSMDSQQSSLQSISSIKNMEHGGEIKDSESDVYSLENFQKELKAIDTNYNNRWCFFSITRMADKFARGIF